MERWELALQSNRSRTWPSDLPLIEGSERPGAGKSDKATSAAARLDATDRDAWINVMGGLSGLQSILTTSQN
jgi:hypothetical protein